jgi:hypothetical protein
LFIAIGTTELNDKMASYIADLNVFVVKKHLPFCNFWCCSLRSEQSIYSPGLYTITGSMFITFHIFPIRLIFFKRLNHPVHTASRCGSANKNTPYAVISLRQHKGHHMVRALIKRNLLSVVYGAILCLSDDSDVSRDKGHNVYRTFAIISFQNLYSSEIFSVSFFR